MILVQTQTIDGDGAFVEAHDFYVNDLDEFLSGFRGHVFCCLVANKGNSCLAVHAVAYNGGNGFGYDTAVAQTKDVGFSK